MVETAHPTDYMYVAVKMAATKTRKNTASMRLIKTYHLTWVR